MIKRNIKMVVTPEESKQVQEICFANGIGWWKNCKELKYIDKPHLLIGDRLYFNYGNRYYDFMAHKYEEVDASLFIRTNGTCIEENQEQKLKQNIEEEQMKDNEVETYKDIKEYLIEWDDEDLIKLNIEGNIESLVQDYKAKQGKEFIQYLETQPEEVLEQPTETKPKQYLVFVPSKGKPKHIHQSLESAQEEAKRLCKSALCEVMVLEVVSKYQAKVIVEEV